MDRSNVSWWVAAATFILVLGTALLVHADELGKFLGHETDSYGYYQYLPAAFLGGDLLHLPWAVGLPNGNTLSLLSIGPAWLQMPFFWIGHIAAKVLGYPTTGFSEPYAVAQLLGVAMYVALGMRMLYGALGQFFDRTTVLCVLLIVLFGGNLYYYSSWEACMSHSYAFFLFAWLFHLAIFIRYRPAAHQVLQLCTCGSLLVLVRPLHGFALFLPLVYGLRTYQEVLARIGQLVRPVGWAIGGSLLAAGILGSELAYWHATTGHWLVFSYGQAGQGFDWSAPHLMNVLFSHQNGWFIYSPVMLPVMYFLLKAAKNEWDGARMMLLVWGLTWYVYSSWWAWWLGAAYGFRGFTELLAWLALPIGWTVLHARARKPWLRISAVAITCFLLLLNVRMTVIYRCCWDGPDWTWARLISAWKEALWLT